MKLKVSFDHTPDYKEFDIPRFEELFQIQYLTHLKCADWHIENWLRKKCAKLRKKGKIGQLALWLGHFHEKDLEAAHIPDIGIRWIGEKIGYGVFATKPLKKWQYIGEYTGVLRRRKIFFPDINDYCFMYPKEWKGLKTFTIDSKNHGNYTRYINHSDTPNCESVSVYQGGLFHILFRTIQDIPEGDQLTYDYGDVYWHKRKKIVNERLEDLISPEALKMIQDIDFSKDP